MKNWSTTRIRRRLYCASPLDGVYFVYRTGWEGVVGDGLAEGMRARGLRRMLCRYCRRRMHRSMLPDHAPDLRRTTQHIMPRGRGGSDSHENRVPCCARCNAILNALDDCPCTMACMAAVGASIAPTASWHDQAEIGARATGAWEAHRREKQMARSATARRRLAR